MTEYIFNSKRHISNRKILEEYECYICYELEQDMKKCIGPCSKPYCLKCQGRIKYQKDVCPTKCSTPFLTIQMNNLKLQYMCPYNPQDCKLIFKSLDEFNQHCKQCPFKTEQGQKEQICRKQFVCNQGHKLQLVTDQLLKTLNQNQYPNFYTLVMNDLCVACGSRNLCRSICIPCSSEIRHVYCVECRKYPFTRSKCPKGHSFSASNIQSNYGCVCDRCGISGSLKSQVGIGYSEYICDIFLCQNCYNICPQYNLPPPKQKQKNEQIQQSISKLQIQPKFQNID